MRSIILCLALLFGSAVLSAQNVYDLFAGDPFASFNKEAKHCSTKNFKQVDEAVGADRVQLTKSPDGVILSGNYIGSLSTYGHHSAGSLFDFSDAVVSCESNGEHVVKIVRDKQPGEVWCRIRLTMEPHDCGFVLKHVQILVGKGGRLRYIEWASWWTAAK